MTPRLFEHLGIYGATLDVTIPTDPGAGAEWSQTVPAGQRWIITAMTWRLQCSANAGNRYPTYIIQTATAADLYRGTAARQAIANELWYISTGPWITTTADATNKVAILDMPMICAVDPGFVINSGTINLDPNDQLSTIAITHFTILI